jgi:hypothetical protein
MFSHFVPIAFVIAYMAVAVLVYFRRNLLAFRGHLRLQRVHDTQMRRFAQFPHAEHITQLQVDTNDWHEKAIAAKTRYEVAGVTACSGAPALICLHAIEPFLHHAHIVSPLGVSIADTFVACTVLLVIWKWRHPSKPHVDSRLRAEALRLRLHCLLAGVGPYASDSPALSLPGAGLEQEGADAVMHDLQEVERECQNQAEDDRKITGFSFFDKGHADVYLLERVGEQERYFCSAAARHRRAYERSARAVFELVRIAAIMGVGYILATFDPIAKWLKDTFAAEPPISDWFRAAFLVAGSTVVLLVSLRAVFGWDSKAALYVRQDGLLHDLIKDLRMQKEAIAQDVPHAAKKFRQTAARLEALMAREACDWRLISDREVYDITF